MANSTYPADFLSDNLRIQLNVMDAALAVGVERLLFLGSSCIYPKFAPQPISEDSLLTGPLEPTNDAYAIAKIAGVMQVQAARRQYGVQLDLRDADEPVRARRQLRPAEVARAAGTDPALPRSEDRRRAQCHAVGHRHAAARVPARRRPGSRVRVTPGTLRRPGADQRRRRRGSRRLPSWPNWWRASSATKANGSSTRRKPDGTPRKLLDVRRINDLGFTAQIPLEQGIRSTYQWYLDQRPTLPQEQPVR